MTLLRSFVIAGLMSAALAGPAEARSFWSGLWGSFFNGCNYDSERPRCPVL